ncbi:MAG TPA: DUF2690 domain-containing protein [Candidatus Limnocylindrales bacterium]
MRWRVKLGVVLSILATVLVTTVVAPTPAMAGGCFSTGCNGKDPQQMLCNQPASQVEILDEIWPANIGGKLELRKSRDCHAAWGRYTNSFGHTGRVEIHGCGENYCHVMWKTLAAYDEELAWSPMLSFTLWVKACVWSNGYSYCTDTF